MNRIPAEMTKLAQQAPKMASDNHGRYLAELIRWYRHASQKGAVDPVASLEFLVALWKSPFASRPDELNALNDVGKWLDDCLVADPHQTAEDLAWRVGWLRRIAHVDQDGNRFGAAAGTSHPKNGNRSGANAGGRSAGGPRQEPQRAFGARIDSIRRARAQAPIVGPDFKETTAGGTLDGVAISALLRPLEKGNAAAKVPEILKVVPAAQKSAVARDILKKLDRKWVEARKDKPWAAELLAATTT